MEVQTRDRMLKLTLLSGVLLFCLSLLVYLTATTAQTVAIQEWTETTPYPTGVANRDVIVHGNHLYVVGGKMTDDAATDAVSFAEINVDGSVGPWMSTQSFPYAVYIHSTTASADHIYVVGGWTSGPDGVITNQVWRAPFMPDGSLGAWQVQTAYPSDVVLHDSIVINDRLYVIGGWNGDDPSRSVRYAPIEAGGLAGWVDVTELPEPIARHAVVYVDGTLYVTGGGYKGGTQYNTVYYADVNAGGGLSAWDTATDLPTARYYHGAVIHDGKLVVLAGRDNTQTFSSVISSVIQSNGSLGEWISEPSLPQAIYRFGAASLQRSGSDYIYAVNGLTTENPSIDNAPETYHNSVYHSTVPPTFTPTPTPGIAVVLNNTPNRWLAPGEEVLYELSLTGSTDFDLTDVIVTNDIPSQTELVPGSVTDGNGAAVVNGGGQAGDTIQWAWPDFGINEVDTVSYRVRRLPPPTPDAQLAFSIVKSGPATVSANEEISYTLTVTNNTGIPQYNIIVEDSLPTNAVYVRGGDGPPDDGIVRWTLPSIGDEARNFTYVVTSTRTLVNSNYWVRTAGGGSIRGLVPVVTVIEGTLPAPNGDGVSISNTGALIEWMFGDQQGSGQSNPVRNPMYDLMLPYILAP